MTLDDMLKIIIRTENHPLRFEIGSVNNLQVEDTIRFKLIKLCDLYRIPYINKLNDYIEERY